MSDFIKICILHSLKFNNILVILCLDLGENKSNWFDIRVLTYMHTDNDVLVLS